MQFNVKGSIILLFATDKKWDLSNIKLKAVTAQGIFFDASCPALVIDTTAKEPIRIGNTEEVFDAAGRDTTSDYLERVYAWSYERYADVPVLLDIVRQETLALCDAGVTRFEKRFLDLYFEHLIKRSEEFLKISSDDRWVSKAKTVCDALMPIPQVWFYCHDPLEPRKCIPENAFRVDFAFWSRQKFYAIEIDGNEPEGYASDVRRDRLLRRAGIDVIHILNSEIIQHGAEITKALVPDVILVGPKGGPGSVPFAFPF